MRRLVNLVYPWAGGLVPVGEYRRDVFPHSVTGGEQKRSWLVVWFRRSIKITYTSAWRRTVK